MTARDHHYGGNLGPYEAIRVEWLSETARVGYAELRQNGIEVDDEGLTNLVYVKRDGEPLHLDGQAFRRIAIRVRHPRSAPLQ